MVRTAKEQEELCRDATRMLNRMFEGDSEWLKQMCEAEIKEREINEAKKVKEK